MKLYLKTEELPETIVFDDLLTRLKAVTTDLKPLSVELSMNERKFTRKMGDRRLAYADAAERFGEQYEAVMPRTFNSSDMTKRLNLHRKMVRVKSAVQQINEMLDDTIMACGVDLMTYTKLVHDGLRSANSINPIYDDVLHRLDEFNKRIVAEEQAVETNESDNQNGVLVEEEA